MPSYITRDMKEATHRLEDLEVFEVSVVDRPANKKPFLVIKSSENTMPKGSALTQDSDGNLVTTDKASFSEKQKKRYTSVLNGAAQKIGSLMEKIATAEDEAVFMKQIQAIANSLGNLSSVSIDAKGEKDPAKKEAQENELHTKLLSNVESVLSAVIEDSKPPEVAKTESGKPAWAEDLERQVAVASKAATTLLEVVKESRKEARPAPQSAPVGEEVTKSDIVSSSCWKLDMNSEDLDESERF